MNKNNNLFCKVCGVAFSSCKKTSLYCSNKCKYKSWAINNSEKAKKSQQTWRNKNKQYCRDRQRPYHLKREYGIDEKEYKRLLDKQNGKCAICETNKPTGKWKVFAVDHCHKTNTIRGILCNECNRGMGLLKDSFVLLRKAAEYIERHQKITNEGRNNER